MKSSLPPPQKKKLNPNNKGRQRNKEKQRAGSQNSSNKSEINNCKTKQIRETQVEHRTGRQVRPTKNEEETQARNKKGGKTDKARK